MKCPKCSAEIKARWKCCPECGEPLPLVPLLEHQGSAATINNERGVFKNEGQIIMGPQVVIHAAGSQSSELEYEKFVASMLQHRGSLDHSRAELNQKASELGVSRTRAREIEPSCQEEHDESNRALYNALNTTSQVNAYVK